MSFKSGKILFRMTTEGGFLMREKIMLVCTECLSRNYNTTKNKQTQKDRLEIKKFSLEYRSMLLAGRLSGCSEEMAPEKPQPFVS